MRPHQALCSSGLIPGAQWTTLPHYAEQFENEPFRYRKGIPHHPLSSRTSLGCSGRSQKACPACAHAEGIQRSVRLVFRCLGRRDAYHTWLASGIPRHCDRLREGQSLGHDQFTSAMGAGVSAPRRRILLPLHQRRLGNGSVDRLRLHLLRAPSLALRQATCPVPDEENAAQTPHVHL